MIFYEEICTTLSNGALLALLELPTENPQEGLRLLHELASGGTSLPEPAAIPTPTAGVLCDRWCGVVRRGVACDAPRVFLLPDGARGLSHPHTHTLRRSG